MKVTSKYEAIKVNGVKYDKHRYIMMQHLGRELTFNEVVHHIDGNKQNNDISNLEVLSRSHHSRLHTISRPLKSETKEKLKKIGIDKRTGAKLTIDDVRQIRNSINAGIKKIKVAQMFGVNRRTIHSICTGQSWYWVE